VYAKSVNLLKISDKKPEQKTMKITFSEGDILNAGSIRKIENMCAAYRGIREQQPRHAMPVRVVNEQNEISRLHELELNEIVRTTAGLKQHEADTDKYWITITFEPGQIISSYCDATYWFFNLDHKKVEPVESGIALLASSLTILGRSDISRGICTLLMERGIYIPNLELMAPLISEIGKSKKPFVEYGLKIGIHKSMDPFLILFVNQLRMDAGESDYASIESFFEQSLLYFKSVGGDAPIGEAHFNFGNVLQSHGKWRESVRQYVAAIRAQPHYSERPHFWQFFGTNFYSLGKYKCAVACYQKAFDLEPHSTRRLYLADALFLSGAFSAALSHYKACEGKFSTHHGALAAINSWIIENLIDLYGDTYSRDRASALAARPSNEVSEEDEIRLATEIIDNHDVLDPWAAFVVANDCFHRSDYGKAVVFYLISLSSTPFNVPGWYNAIAAAHKYDDRMLVYSTIVAANGLVGFQLTQFFAEQEANGDVPDGLSDSFAELQLNQNKFEGTEGLENPANGTRIWFDDPKGLHQDLNET
jgi:tetratricopeptide (TPR) repeat protein